MKTAEYPTGVLHNLLLLVDSIQQLRAYIHLVCMLGGSSVFWPNPWSRCGGTEQGATCSEEPSVLSAHQLPVMATPSGRCPCIEAPNRYYELIHWYFYTFSEKKKSLPFATLNAGEAESYRLGKAINRKELKGQLQTSSVDVYAILRQSNAIARKMEILCPVTFPLTSCTLLQCFIANVGFSQEEFNAAVATILFAISFFSYKQ